jgi:carbon-monoxide dehydrogenase medium subunit
LFPAPFEYAAPRSLEEALAILAEHGDEAKVMAGGQSLIPLLKLRFARPQLVVDLNNIPGLAFIDETRTGGSLRIGALARHNDLVDSELLATAYPALSTAAPLVSDPIVRNRGTLGGSLAHADPAGDLGSVMLAMGAKFTARSATGKRTIAARDFFRGTFTTALEPTEILTEIRIPRPAPLSGGTYLKLERKVGDFATVGVAVQLDLSNGTIGRAGIALTAVGPQNIQCTAAEKLLKGAAPSEEAFREAAEEAAKAAEPASDVRGSAEYKRHVVRVYVRRGLEQALEQAQAAA